jgi:1-acyl-sn-glycerol-3-phosphate acyltransferase
MEFLKTFGVFFLTGFTLVVYLVPALILAVVRLFGLRRLVAFCLYKLAQLWARTLIVLTGCPMTVSGRENIPKKGGICFVSNHVGIFDIMLALAYANRPFGFIAKKELLLVPGINLWILLLGGLFIDRGQPKSALKTINQGVKRIEAGGAMLIFPEGTRSRGRGIAPFLPGAFKLASRSGALIVPVAITGSFDVFEKTRRVKAVPVSVTFLPVVDSSKLPPADRKLLLAEQLHGRIAEVLETNPAPMVNSL